MATKVAMKNLPILRGTLAGYNAMEKKDPDIIYVLTDARQVYIGEVKIGDGSNLVKSAYFNQETYILKLIHTDNSTVAIKLGTCYQMIRTYSASPQYKGITGLQYLKSMDLQIEPNTDCVVTLNLAIEEANKYKDFKIYAIASSGREVYLTDISLTDEANLKIVTIEAKFKIATGNAAETIKFFIDKQIKDDVPFFIKDNSGWVSVFTDKANAVNTKEAQVELDVTVTTANQSFQFAGQTFTDGTYIDWGDGEIALNPANNPVHTYKKVGIYTLKMYGHSKDIDYYSRATSSRAMVTGELLVNPLSDDITLYNFSGTNVEKATVKTKTSFVRMFLDCAALTEVSCPKMTTLDNHYTFQGCTKLAKVTFGDLVTTLSTNATSGAFTGLTTTNIDLFLKDGNASVTVGTKTWRTLVWKSITLI